MAFQKGKSGNPGGRSTNEKAFADSVRLAAHRVHEGDPEGRKKLTLLGEKLVDLALAGESWAMQQVADRLDGKPAQESTVTIDDKRDATDWTRGELVAFLNDARARRDRASEADGSAREPDSVH